MKKHPPRYISVAKSPGTNRVNSCYNCMRTYIPHTYLRSVHTVAVFRRLQLSHCSTEKEEQLAFLSSSRLFEFFAYELFGIFEIFGIFCNLFKYFGMFWSILGILWNPLESFEIFWNPLESFGILLHSLEALEICRSAWDLSS